MPRFSRATLATLCVFAAASSTTLGDVVYLKDGTVLHGRVIEARETFTDPATGASISVPRGDGVYAIYDGTRIVTFSRLQLDPNRPPDVKVDIRSGLLRLERTSVAKPYRQPPGGDIRGKLEFTDAGKRTIKIYVPKGHVNVDQLLTFLSPYQMRIYTIDYAWTQNYLTDELPRPLVESLAKKFPSIRDEKDPIEQRMRWNRFMVEAKWYEEAAKDLDDIEKKLPTAKERVEKAREALKQLGGERTLDFATNSFAAGQMQIAQSFLAAIPRQGLDGDLNVRVNALRVKVDDQAKRYDLAMRFLRTLPDEAEGVHAEVLCDAASYLRQELNVEALDRLEPFVNLAEQAERVKKSGGVVADKPEQLLARAVSGWLLGKQASDSRPEVAGKLWKARRMVEQYVRTPILQDRNKLLTRYEKSEPVEVEELARIIALLGPPAPAELPPPTEFQRPQDRKTELPSPNHQQTDYKILLPPEYRPGRPYPMLVVLHDDKEPLAQVMERYGYEAIRNGYILVGAEWGTGFGNIYGYNPDERQRVLDVIRDVRLRYHVDSDRIFLSGYGDGANAAWDIGLSQPDIFAGVVPIAGDPSPTLLQQYWPNAMHLPFYLVNGEYGGQFANKFTMKVMEYWINKGYPCLNVIYQGRGHEWFAAELPMAFEWMGRRKRANPFPELGRWPTGDQSALYAMRQTDGRRYWLSSDSIKENALIENKAPRAYSPARMQAIIRPGNDVTISTFGLNEVSLWLGPGMIDFTRPVTVKLTGFRNVAKPKKLGLIKPNLSLMLEDYLERGDSTRLYLFKASFNPNAP